MLLIPIIGFAIIGSTNYISSKVGYSNYTTGDKDILFPFSTMIFIFFSFLIYLPQVTNILFQVFLFSILFQVHSKIIQLQSQFPNTKKQFQSQQEQQSFPLAFLFSLLAITLSVFIDKFFLNKSVNQKNQDQYNLHNSPAHNQNNNEINKNQVTSLKYYLTIGILLINLFSSFFVVIQHRQSSIWSQLFIFLLFSLILNFSFGFLLGWSHVQQKLSNKLFIFVNSGGIVVGLIIASLFSQLPAITVLPCISIGLFIYTGVFICLPKIFTNGQKRIQDKFRYWAIFTSLLLTLIYYPILYLLKI